MGVSIVPLNLLFSNFAIRDGETLGKSVSVSDNRAESRTENTKMQVTLTTHRFTRRYNSSRGGASEKK
jgi:hypothetical protein